MDAVHNAVVLEEVAKMGLKHGPGAYYGQKDAETT
jgi:hypothetical protein